MSNSFSDYKNSSTHAQGKSKHFANNREYQFTKRTKGVSMKNKLKKTLSKLYKKALSKEDFFKRLSEAGLQVYSRGGKVAGIIGERKMRFTTLGLDLNNLDGFEKIHSSLKSIRNIRNNRFVVGKNIGEQEDEPQSERNEKMTWVWICKSEYVECLGEFRPY